MEAEMATEDARDDITLAEAEEEAEMDAADKIAEGRATNCDQESQEKI
jgi:hypothetical protein